MSSPFLKKFNILIIENRVFIISKLLKNLFDLQELYFEHGIDRAL